MVNALSTKQTSGKLHLWFCLAEAPAAVSQGAEAVLRLLLSRPRHELLDFDVLLNVILRFCHVELPRVWLTTRRCSSRNTVSELAVFGLVVGRGRHVLFVVNVLLYICGPHTYKWSRIANESRGSAGMLLTVLWLALVEISA